MTVIKIIHLLLSLLKAYADYAEKQSWIKQGEAQSIRKALENSIDVLDQANKARADAQRRFDESGGVPDESDPNLRD